MKSRKRRFAYEGTEHIFKNTKDGGLLFYTLSDYLVFFTITCVAAEKKGVTLAALTLMRDHVHEELEVHHPLVMAEYEQLVNAWYAQEFNRSCGREGQLFNHPYGSAPKRTESRIRDSFAYLGNNPVERKLCRKAIDYRWNFLAYAHNPHPFSKPLVIREASAPLKRAVNLVKPFHKQRNILNYRVLERLFRTLDKEEVQQLADFIISTYNVIDYDAAVSWYGSFDKMIAAPNKSDPYSEGFISRLARSNLGFTFFAQDVLHRLLCLTGTGDDETLVVLQGLQPACQVGRVVLEGAGCLDAGVVHQE